MSELRAFLDVLYGDCTDGKVECRALPSKQRAWATPGDWTPFGPFLNAQLAARQDLYVGVCTRVDATSGTTNNLHTMPSVWLDFDKPKADLDLRLKTLPFAPSLIVMSGLYYQLHWLLKEPFEVRETKALARAASVLRRLSGHLGGDPNACDPARILRLPQTFNHKYDHPRLVTLLSTSDTRIHLSELEDFLPPEVIVNNQWTTGAILKGQRNDTLHSRGRSLRCAGTTLPEIARELERLNTEWCRPPLSADELRRVVNSVWVQRDRADFVPPVVIHDATPPPPVPDGAAIFVNLGDVQAEAVTWHWSHRVATGKGTMLAGDPGTGKSIITTSLAAMYTTGGAWPDGGFAPKGRVIFLCAEDGLADTVKPRVVGHGGDPSMVEVLTAVQDKKSERPFNLSRDIAVLEAGLQKFQPKLLVIDPLNAYLGRVDSYRDADIRGVLSPLLACIEKYDCALIWVSHLTKNDEVKALYRPGASIGFIASARMALIVGEHPQQPGTMVLAQSKNNLAPLDRSLSFKVSDGRVCWGSATDLTADAILQTTDPEEAEMSWTADGLIAQLRKDAANGVIDVKEANERAALLGIPERTLRRAARRAQLTAYSKGQGREHRGYWFDPEHAGHPTAGGPTPPDMATVADVTGVEGMPATSATPAMPPGVGVADGNGHQARKEGASDRVNAQQDSTELNRTEGERS